MTEDTQAAPVAPEETQAEAPVEAAPAVEATSEVQPTEELLAGKFKTVEDLAKSYKHLESKLGEMGSKLPKAPENYDFGFDENEAYKELGVDLTEDPIYKAMVPSFKEKNLTQEQAKGIMDLYISEQAQLAKQIKEDMEKEIASIEDYDGKSKFISSKLTSFLPEEQANALMNGDAHKAAYTEGFNNLLRHMTKADVSDDIPTDAQATVSQETSEQLKKQARELRSNTPNFERNMKARAEYESIMNKASAIDVELERKSQNPQRFL